MTNTMRLGAIGVTLAVTLAVGCGTIEAFDNAQDAGAGGAQALTGGAGGSGGAVATAGTGGEMAAPGTGGAGSYQCPDGYSMCEGVCLVVGRTCGTTGTGGSGGELASGGTGGAGGAWISGGNGRPPYPACVSNGGPARPSLQGNAQHQQATLGGYDCADCLEAAAPPGYSGFEPPSATVAPYACLTPDFVLCVVDVNQCR